MGKTIYTVSGADGAILKASKSKSTCEAFIAGRLNGRQHALEPVITAEGDPALLYRVRLEDIDNQPQYETSFALTTLRLS